MKWLIWVMASLLAAVWTVAMAVAAFVVDWTGRALQQAGSTPGTPGPLPAELPPWLAGWMDSAEWAAIGQAMQQAMGMLPSVASAADGLEALVWIVWALGMGVLLCVALGLHWLVNRQRRQSGTAVGPPSAR
ncbi:MAG: hypothetical protein V4739_09365 [Pseudomonadota bacterium]